MSVKEAVTTVYQEYHRSNPRLQVFYYLIIVVFAILASGLFYKQLIQGAEYREKEIRQSQRRILLPASRGNIFDRNGNLLVGNEPMFSAVVYLNEPEFRTRYIEVVREARRQSRNFNAAKFRSEARSAVVQEYLDTINEILGTDYEVNERSVERHFNQSLLLPLVLVEGLELDQYARLIQQLPVDSPIQIMSDSIRYYPYGEMAAHVIGYVGATENISEEGVPGGNLRTFYRKGKVGRTGLELAFDDHLQGESGGEIWIVDPAGYQFERADYKSPTKGNDLYLSLDVNVQRAAELALGNRTGAIVAMDVHTGEVLAMASQPAYDLNDFSPRISTEVWKDTLERGALENRAARLPYPPGSTFKIITTIAGLRNHAISEGTTSYCSGYYMVGNRRFPCHNHAGHGEVDLTKSIQKSCNVFYYEHSQEIGPTAIAEEARRFGLGKPTGIELPFETTRTLIPDPEWKRNHPNGNIRAPWYAGDTANMSIGQGYLLVTPLQMAAFTASLARNETLTKPTILKHNGGPVDHGGEAIGLPLEDYRTIIEGMEQVVSSEGTGRLAQIPGLRIAGKSGTAQFRAHGEDRHLAWFIAFAPVENPQIAVAVMVEGTQQYAVQGGGSTAGPIVRSVLQEYFKQKNSALAGQ